MNKYFTLFLSLLTTVLALRSSGTVVGSNLTLGWEFDKDFIQVEIKLKTTTFAPILLGDSMTNADLWYCSQESDQTSWSVKDSWSLGHRFTPSDVSLGGRNDLYDANISTLNDELTCSFKRKLITGDEFDTALQRGKNIKVCSYSSTTQGFSKHVNPTVRYCFYWPLIDGYQGQLHSQFQSSSFTLAHGIILTICWGFLMDISIIIIRFLRTLKYYKVAHAAFFFVINLASLPFIIIMMIKQNVNIFHNFEFMDPINKIHFILGFSILILLVVEHGIGIATKFIQQNPNAQPKKFVIMRIFHQFTGYTLFVLTKAQILIGWWMYGQSKTLVLIVLLVWFVVLIAANALLTELFKKGKLRKMFALFQKQNAKLATESSSILSEIADSSGQLVNAIEQNKSKQQIREQLSSSKYVFFKDKICLLKNFDHPGGAAIFERSIGLDVTKYIYGGMALQGSKIKANQHSEEAIRLLESFSIGSHIKSKILLQDTSKWQIKSLEELNQNLFKFNFTNPTFEISTNPKDYNNYIGYYVLVATEKAARTYTLVLSQMECNIKYRNTLINLCSNNFKNVNFEITPLQKTNEFPLIIKRYNQGIVSTQIHQRNKLKTISGIYGIGLGIQPGVNVILTGGTGLLPFLDLFDLLLKKAIFMIGQKLNIQNLDQYNIYNVDYKNAYPDSKFVLYSSFRQMQQFNHFKWLNNLHEISAQYDLGIFEMYVKDHSFKSLKTFSGRINSEFFSKRLSKQSFSRLLICGPPEMNDDILDILNTRQYDQSKYLIM